MSQPPENISQRSLTCQQEFKKMGITLNKAGKLQTFPLGSLATAAYRVKQFVEHKNEGLKLTLWKLPPGHVYFLFNKPFADNLLKQFCLLQAVAAPFCRFAPHFSI